MKQVNATTGRILDAITDGLEIGESRTLDNAPGVYMATHVDRLTASTYSVAHYFEQNGDLVADPDGVFWRSELGGWFPVSLQLCTGHYTVAIKLGSDGQPEAFSPRAGRELASFASMWLRNVKNQQGVKVRRPRRK